MSENFVEMENVENVENVENQPIKPTKKPITELKRQQLIKAREAAHIKKQEIKELNLKSKNLKLEESKLKAFQYDELMKKKEEIMKKAESPKEDIIIIPKEEVIIKNEEVVKKPKKKRIIKKIIYDDGSSEECEVLEVEKHKPQPVQSIPFNPYLQHESYNQLLYQNACEKIQTKLHEERAKALIHSLMPSYR